MNFNEDEFSEGRHIPIKFEDSPRLEVIVHKEQITKENSPCSNCGNRAYEQPVYGNNGRLYCSDPCKITAEKDTGQK